MPISGCLQQIKKASREIVGWVKRNPLKVSGLAGMTAEALIAYAGEFSMGDHLLFAGGLLGVSAHFTELVWGHGGKEEAKRQQATKKLYPAKPQSSKQGIRDLFSIEKCLSCWRFPVESAAFQSFLSGVCYATPAVLSYLKHGVFKSDEVSLLIFGFCCMIGSFYANCVPEREGKISPLAKAACWYGLCTLSLLGTAVSTLAPPLIIATAFEAISDYSLGVSVRHDNKLRQQASALVPQM